MFRKRRERDNDDSGDYNEAADDSERPTKVSRKIEPNAAGAVTLDLSPKGGAGGDKLDPFSQHNKTSVRRNLGDSLGMGAGSRDAVTGGALQANAHTLLGGDALGSLGMPVGALPSLGLSLGAGGNQMQAFNANAGFPTSNEPLQGLNTANAHSLQPQSLSNQLPLSTLTSSLPVYDARMDQTSGAASIDAYAALQQQHHQQQNLALLLQSQNSLQTLAGLNPLFVQQQPLSGLSTIDQSLLLLQQQQQQQQDLNLNVPSWLLHANLPSRGMPAITPQTSSLAAAAGAPTPSSMRSKRSSSKNTPRVENTTPIPQLSRDYGKRVPMVEATSDSSVLSPFQCYAREQIEFFEALPKDVQQGARGRNVPISLGQVGIRCMHCRDEGPMSRGRAAVYFPTKFELIYQCSINMTSIHLCEHCTKVPKDIREKLLELRDQRSTAGGGKGYWAKATKKVGIIETCQGLRFTD
ncbi:MAG: hypothetical protein SGILL_003009 [Bacillariaceae sp.]